MSVKSLQGRRTTYATRIKLMNLKVQNTTVKTNESWDDSWRCRVLVQIECRQTVPHRRTSDGECPIAKTKSGARDDEVSTRLMFSILKIVHTRPDVSSRQLSPYSNSGKLLTTDSFAHAYQHATATIQTIKLYRAHSTLSWHQLLPRGEPHVLTSSRDALASANE